MDSINDLYQDNADLYNAISDDRDFRLQSETLLNLVLRPTTKVAELFAGLGNHGFEFQKKGINCVAVDSSPEMKRYSIKAGNYEDNTYLVGTLPFYELPCNFRDFDAFLLLRYSCGYLNICELNKLIKQCKKAATKGSSLFIESHSMKSVYNGLSELSIVTRKTSINDTSVSCVWPCERPVFDTFSHTADLKVSVSFEDTNHYYISRENFHSFELIEFLAIQNGLTVTCHDFSAPGSIFPGSIVSQIHF